MMATFAASSSLTTAHAASSSVRGRGAVASSASPRTRQLSSGRLLSTTALQPVLATRAASAKSAHFSCAPRAAVQYEPDDDNVKETKKKVQKAADEPGSTGDAIKEKTEEASHWVQERWDRAMHPGDAESFVKDKARDVKSKVENTSRDVNHRAKSTVHDISSTAQRNVDKTNKKLRDEVVNKQPAWVRQFALVTGVVIFVAAVGTTVIVPLLRNISG